jgi:hypothetical protein
MGVDVIPLVVAALAHKENFMAVQLYEDLQPDAGLRVSNSASPGTAEQQHARTIIDKFLASRT